MSLPGLVAVVDECGPLADKDGLCVGDIVLTMNGSTASEQIPAGPVKMKIVRHNCECERFLIRACVAPPPISPSTHLAYTPHISHTVFRRVRRIGGNIGRSEGGV